MSEPYWEIAMDTDGKWHWMLWAANGRAVATNALPFDRLNDATNGIKKIARLATQATAITQATQPTRQIRKAAKRAKYPEPPKQEDDPTQHIDTDAVQNRPKSVEYRDEPPSVPFV